MKKLTKPSMVTDLDWADYLTHITNLLTLKRKTGELIKLRKLTKETEPSRFYHTKMCLMWESFSEKEKTDWKNNVFTFTKKSAQFKPVGLINRKEKKEEKSNDN